MTSPGHTAGKRQRLHLNTDLLTPLLSLTVGTGPTGTLPAQGAVISLQTYSTYSVPGAISSALYSGLTATLQGRDNYHMQLTDGRTKAQKGM